MREHVLHVAFLERLTQSLQQLFLGAAVRGALALGDQSNSSPLQFSYSSDFSQRIPVLDCKVAYAVRILWYALLCAMRARVSPVENGYEPPQTIRTFKALFYGVSIHIDFVRIVRFHASSSIAKEIGPLGKR